MVNRKPSRKGATQVDYILAAGIFILFFALAVQFITDYFSGVKDTTDVLALRSQALDILTAADRGYDPAAWPQLTNNSNDLVVLLHLNNNTLDYSGKGNNGTAMSGANCSSSVTGRFFSGCALDGIGSYINVSGNPALNDTSAITVEAWVNFRTVTGVRPIARKYYYPSAPCSWWLEFDQANNPSAPLRFGVRNNSETVASGSFSPVAGQWYHVAGTYNGTTVSVYRDGSSIGTAAMSGRINVSDCGIDIGHERQTNWFNGTVDEVAVYNRSLSAAEILNHYQQGLNRLGLASPAYRFELVLNNTKSHLANTSENATAQDLLNEIIRFNLSALGFNDVDYNSVVIYNSTGHGVPFMISGSNITFLVNITANTSQKFTLYFNYGSAFGDKSRDISGGADNLTETLLPAEKIQLLQYHKLRHLNETNYTNIKNTAGIESGFSIKLYDIDDNTTFMSFGGSVPRSGDVVALQRYVLFQNSTAGIRNGRLTVQTW